MKSMAYGSVFGLMVLLCAPKVQASEPPAQIKAMLRWQVHIHADPLTERRVKTAARRFSGDAWQPVAGIPRSHGKFIIIRTPRRVVATQFDTGQRIFEYPWFQPKNTASNKLKVREELTLTYHIWQDVAFSQLSAAGSTFFVSEPTEPVKRDTRQKAKRWVNALTAISIAREGAVQWTLQGEPSDFKDGNTQLAYILGGVAEKDGRIYMLAECEGVIRLQCHELKTAKQLWTVDLKDTGRYPVSVNYWRRIAGATPTIAGDAIICPLNDGMVVCLDLKTKKKRWTVNYTSRFPKLLKQPSLRRGEFPFDKKPFDQLVPGAPTLIELKTTPDLSRRWFGAAVHVVENRVLLSPADSRNLHCVDLQTGRAIWPAASKDKSMYVAAVHRGKVFLAGRDNLIALDFATGKTAWEKPLRFGSNIAGIGCANNGDYFMPLQSKEIAKVSLSSGKIQSRISVETAPGNLIWRDGSIISQTATDLSRFDLPQK